MSNTVNGTQNSLLINGTDQAQNKLPVFSLQNPGTLEPNQVSNTTEAVIAPFPTCSFAGFLTFGDLNTGVTFALNKQDNHRITIVGFSARVTETVTAGGTVGLTLGYTDALDEIATITDIVETAGTLRVWSDTTNVTLGDGWVRQIPEDEIILKSNGTLTAGTISFCLEYYISPTIE